PKNRASAGTSERSTHRTGPPPHRRRGARPPGPPAPRNARPAPARGGAPPAPGRRATGDGGRGLLIVEAVADLWGVSERRPGKVVWCEFRTSP
ncbi:ATP-binding protein, partial [Streptomyces vinaceus]|uniref:ATP-binding protein n=1 Tax=Streptomyces vinaceus TaxID=1960 RepID=UPI0036A5EE55